MRACAHQCEDLVSRNSGAAVTVPRIHDCCNVQTKLSVITLLCKVCIVHCNEHILSSQATGGVAYCNDIIYSNRTIIYFIVKCLCLSKQIVYYIKIKC